MLIKGDNVFICYNGSYNGNIFNIIKEVGLTPFYYGNVGLEVKNSNLDKEIRSDLYKSKVAIILLLGKSQRKNKRINDNWAIPELEYALSSGIKVIIYITEEVTKEELARIIHKLDFAVLYMSQY